MRNAHDQSSAIFRNIVNPIGDGDPDLIGAEVVIIDATRSRFPTLTRIFGGNLLLIDPQGIAQVMEQAGNAIG